MGKSLRFPLMFLLYLLVYGWVWGLLVIQQQLTDLVDDALWALDWLTAKG